MAEHDLYNVGLNSFNIEKYIIYLFDVIKEI